MIFCVMSFARDENNDSCTNVWMDAVDKGELWHINDTTFMFFTVTEEVARCFFTTHKLEWFCTVSNPKQEVIQNIMSPSTFINSMISSMKGMMWKVTSYMYMLCGSS